MKNQFKHGNKFFNDIADQRLADKIAIRMLFLFAGVLIGVVIANTF